MTLRERWSGSDRRTDYIQTRRMARRACSRVAVNGPIRIAHGSALQRGKPHRPTRQLERRSN